MIYRLSKLYSDGTMKTENIKKPDFDALTSSIDKGEIQSFICGKPVIVK